MDFDELRNQHLHWKYLVESLFDETDNNILNPAFIVKDNDCVQEKWIQSKESEAFSSNKAFQKLQTVHKNFHHVAGRIILAYQAGQVNNVKILLPLFAQASEEIVMLLSQLKKELK